MGLDFEAYGADLLAQVSRQQNSTNAVALLGDKGLGH